MEEPQQVMKGPQQVTTKEPQQVTTKNPKEVEAGRTLAAHNRRKREELKMKGEEQGESRAKSELSQYYTIGAVIAVGVIGGLGYGYYIYRTKKGDVPNNPPKQPSPQSNKFEIN